MKKMISVKVSPGVEILLKRLAEKENRSQGQQIEKMITEECKKQKLK